MILYRNFWILYLHLIMIYLIFKIPKRAYTWWFIALGTTICADLREEDSDWKECHGTSHHIIMMTSVVGMLFTCVDIPNTSFHNLPIQNFDSTWVKASWFTKKGQVLSTASSLQMWWYWGVQYVLQGSWLWRIPQLANQESNFYQLD